jgi:hypothetical protein
MARDRIIYNVEGLFVGPYSGEQNPSSDYYLSGYQILKKLEKVQSFNYAIQKNELDAQGFGQKQNIFRGQGLAPEVTFNFSYIPDGVTNENRLDFNVADFKSSFQAPMFSGLCSNNPLLNKRDFYLIINKNDNDLFKNYPLSIYSIDPTGLDDVLDPNSRNYGILHFQNAYLNEYSFSTAVGNLPEVNQSYVADNITYYLSGSNIKYSILNLRSGFAENQSDQIIIPKSLNYNDPEISGQNILLPGDASVTFYTNNTGVAFYTDTIQSLDFSLNFNRKAYRSINYLLPLLRKIEFPINGTLNTSFIVKENLSGSFLDTLNSDDNYNVIVNFNKCSSNNNGIYPTRFIFSGCRFNNINYDSSIGSNKTATLSFNFDLDPDFGRRGIFASGNVLYCNATSTLEGTESSVDYQLTATENSIVYTLGDNLIRTLI